MDVTGIVLAGGRSRRMGRDKRLVEIDGRPMLRRAIDLLALVSDDVVMVCRADDVPAGALLESGAAGAVRLASDAIGEGPLAGIEAGLRAARHDVAVVVPVDMPRLNAAFLLALVDALAADPEADASLLATRSGVGTFPAAYRRRVLPALVERLRSGTYAVKGFHAAIRTTLAHVEEIEAAAPDALGNVNTSDDLEAIR